MAVSPNKSLDRLFEAVLRLETLEDCYSFFDDLCTVKEIMDMAQRLETAFLLDEGMNYQAISGAIGISTATISRVSRCLRYGSGGYQKAIRKAKEAENNEL